jgi:phosphoglucomutase
MGSIGLAHYPCTLQQRSFSKINFENFIAFFLLHFKHKAPFVHIEDIVKAHWKSYGRNFYCRYDYEGVATAHADEVFKHLRSQFASLIGQRIGDTMVCTEIKKF